MINSRKPGNPLSKYQNRKELSDLEQFHPDRMASRILGMGDVLSIIEKAEEAITEEEAEKLEAQLRKNKFDLDDYLTQLRQIKKMGSFSSILKMIPGLAIIANELYLGFYLLFKKSPIRTNMLH